jgi:hypothetical protein
MTSSVIDVTADSIRSLLYAVVGVAPRPAAQPSPTTVVVGRRDVSG